MTPAQVVAIAKASNTQQRGVVMDGNWRDVENNYLASQKHRYKEAEKSFHRWLNENGHDLF